MHSSTIIAALLSACAVLSHPSREDINALVRRQDSPGAQGNPLPDVGAVPSGPASDVGSSPSAPIPEAGAIPTLDPNSGSSSDSPIPAAASSDAPAFAAPTPIPSDVSSSPSDVSSSPSNVSSSPSDVSSSPSDVPSSPPSSSSDLPSLPSDASAPTGVPIPAIAPSNGAAPAPAAASGGPTPNVSGPDSDTHGHGGKGGNTCPDVWTSVMQDLTDQFTSGGQCNDLARGAIRVAFHDCGAWKTSLGNSAGCDGSLYLAEEEISRPENAGLTDVIPVLGKIADKYDVGVADFFQFAGAMGVKSCAGGPTVQVYVGRKDRYTANPEGLIPNPRSPAADLIANMGAKGINPTELVALLGSHTAAKQFAFDPKKSGAPLDNSPSTWDVKFYSAVIKNKAPFILPSDKVLSQYKSTAATWKQFAGDQSGWAEAFAPAMTKLGLSGVRMKGLVDCTSVITDSESWYSTSRANKGVNGTFLEPIPAARATPSASASPEVSAIPADGKSSSSSTTVAVGAFGNYIAMMLAAALALAL